MNAYSHWLSPLSFVLIHQVTTTIFTSVPSFHRFYRRYPHFRSYHKHHIALGTPAVVLSVALRLKKDRKRDTNEMCLPLGWQCHLSKSNTGVKAKLRIGSSQGQSSIVIATESCVRAGFLGVRRFGGLCLARLGARNGPFLI